MTLPPRLSDRLRLLQWLLPPAIALVAVFYQLGPASYVHDHYGHAAQISRLLPDAVLVEEREEDDPGAVIDILKAGSSDLRVIRLSLADNELKVYDRKQRKIVELGDLLHMIEQRGPP